MASVVPVVLQRHFRRVSSSQQAVQRRHRASLAATLEDLKTPVGEQAPSATPRPVVPTKVKTYEEIPTPRGYPLLGTLPSFLAAGGVQYHHRYISQRHRELGGIFRETLGGSEMVFVSDPATVRQVFAAEGPYPRHFIPEAWLLYNHDRQAKRGLFFMDGEEWKENRRVLNVRLLRPSSVTLHQDAFGQVADSLLRCWSSLTPGCPIPHLERDLYRWNIESLGVMVFGSRLGFLSEDSESSNTNSSRNKEEMERFIEAIHGIFKETCAMGTFPPALAKALRLPIWNRFADAVDRALGAGQQLVLEGLKASRERQERGQAPVALLDHLLQEDGLQDVTIIRLLTDLFLAAADTTSHTAIWSLYLLGRHPKEAERARREVLTATGGSREVKGNHLSSLPYLKGVVKEALRMYPVAPFQTRVLGCDTQLAGYLVKAGTMVVLSVYTTGRDPAHFTNPHQFCPERWLRDAPEVTTTNTCPINSEAKSCTSPSGSISTTSSAPIGRLHSHAFIPFGVGSRSCIGRRVAETQLHLLLAKLLAASDLRAVNQVDMVMRMVGVTSEPLQLLVTPLSDEASE
ncbi:hypothetical protein OTU49_015369 [Cherax quadricarinatus]|uniref:Uncharacterized protein n=1 Tax=Cherax quadricarinatus TaxID=27406 RepID=A0AAW0YCP9_CHEQU|nr:cytochrome P450 315a1, mitochondrial-like [Cherax quadricarinatus]